MFSRRKSIPEKLQLFRFGNTPTLLGIPTLGAPHTHWCRKAQLKQETYFKYIYYNFSNGKTSPQIKKFVIKKHKIIYFVNKLTKSECVFWALLPKPAGHSHTLRKSPGRYGQGCPSHVGLPASSSTSREWSGMAPENCALRPLASPHPIERERSLNKARCTKTLGYRDVDKLVDIFSFT